jgi:hypothetical protein
VCIRLTGRGDELRAKAVPLPGVIGDAMGLPVHELEELRATLRGLTDSVNAYREARPDV